jgi:hypothetical protein
VSTAVDEQVEEEGEEGTVAPPGTLPDDGDVEEESGDVEEPEAVTEPPEPAQEPSPSIEAQERAVEKLAKRADTYRKAIPEILGDLAESLEQCPRCLPWAPGYYLPPQLAPVSDEQRVAVKQSIGELVDPEYRQDKNTTVCTGCDGYGRVTTGSKVTTARVLRCEDCDGRGWIGPRAVRSQAHTPATPYLDPTPVEQEEAAKPLTDPWGRTIDDALYGVMPGFERD